MPDIKLVGTLFEKLLAGVPGGKFELLIYPWSTSLPESMMNGKAPIAIPVGMEGKIGARTFSARVPAELPASVVFAIRYTARIRPPGSPQSFTIAELICRTGIVETKDDFVPSEIRILDLISPDGIDVTSMSTMLQSENVWFGMLPTQKGITVSNGLLVCNVYFYGLIGTMSGEARLFLSLKPAKVPHPGRVVDVVFVSAEGIGLAKSIFIITAPKKVIPGVQASLDDFISEAIKDNIGDLDRLIKTLTNGQAKTRSRGIMLHDFKLAATITSSFFVSYPIA
jgi:hypothetical protein